jgi:RimJ/RimL family protein N-acetyltransferase
MTNQVSLRDVKESDLPTFFDQQLDPEATRMAAFPSRDRDSFMAHWAKSMADKTTTLQTIMFDGRVVGNILCWEQSGERAVGYWIGSEYWGKGIASEALSQFLGLVEFRPLVAHVAKQNIASLRVLQKCGFTISNENKFPSANDDYGDEYMLTLETSEGMARSLLLQADGQAAAADGAEDKPRLSGNPLAG